MLKNQKNEKKEKKKQIAISIFHKHDIPLIWFQYLYIKCLNIFWIWSWTSYILIQQLATIAHLLNIFINTTQTYSTLASFQHLLLLNNIPIRNPPHLENRSNHHCPVESRKPATRSSLIIRGKIVEREKRVEPRAVPGGTKDPRYRCQRRGSSYTKWVKVGNPFWGWSTTSRLSLSLSGHHVPCLCPPCLYTPTPWNLAPCRWVLSGVNALAQCTYSNPNLDDLEVPSRPGLAWPWSRLINRIPMMIIRGHGHCGGINRVRWFITLFFFRFLLFLCLFSFEWFFFFGLFFWRESRLIKRKEK